MKQVRLTDEDRAEIARAAEQVEVEGFAERFEKSLAVLSAYQQSRNPENRRRAELIAASDWPTSDAVTMLLGLRPLSGGRGRDPELTSLTREALANLRPRYGIDPPLNPLIKELERLGASINVRRAAQRRRARGGLI